MKRDGFTLLEILVALAVLAIFTLALLAFTQTTISSNQIARAQAQLWEEVKDAAGYLADTLQEARAILGSANVNVNGEQCSPPNCIAALIPNPSGNLCQLKAYRLKERKDVSDDYKSPNAWADANTRMLLEYRLNNQNCSATTFSQAQWYVVLDLIDKENLQLFSLASNPLRITLNLRVKNKVGNRELYVPGRDQVYTLTIYPRNAQ
ncbi:PulJ/GspJ family protein [Thermus albus]|uniref:PulJ/GspJ family protein n=1 Tax=Thermus albus TaxID=2908146 RepID=UPI001FA9A4F5|nr:prepilin-type N-terminal cleavage/methylation domain-containing protein [Thermus albus]